MMTQMQAKQEFLRWFQGAHPNAYRSVLIQGKSSGGISPEQLAGFWDTVTGVFDRVSNAVVKVGGAYVSGKAALDLVKANIARAKQGLPPVNSLEEANALIGQRGGGMFSSIPPVVLYAGVGFIAYLIFKRL